LRCPVRLSPRSHAHCAHVLGHLGLQERPQHPPHGIRQETWVIDHGERLHRVVIAGILLGQELLL
jgi:hypothetical protein